MKKGLFLPFLLAIFAMLISSALFPAFKLMAFAPFLALVFMRRTLLISLWIAALVGFLLDLLGSGPYGLHMLGFSVITILLYPQRRFFWGDEPISLGCYSFLISLLFSLLCAIYFGKLNSLEMIRDLCFMSLCDGLYAGVWFGLPLKCKSVKLKSLLKGVSE
jgi:rod shape-determining protein MreD